MIKKIMKGMAIKLVDDVLNRLAESDEEDRILLVRSPGAKGQNYLDIHVEMNYEEGAAIPFYVSRIIESAANDVGVSYDRMVELAGTFRKIVRENFDEDNSITREVKEIK